MVIHNNISALRPVSPSWERFCFYPEMERLFTLVEDNIITSHEAGEIAGEKAWPLSARYWSQWSPRYGVDVDDFERGFNTY